MAATAWAWGANPPTTRPAGDADSNARSYPPPELVAACGKRADEIRRDHGKTLGVLVAPPFVVAGDMPPDELGNYARWSVVRPAKAMWAGYFRKRPDQPITVLLFAGKKGYGEWARKDYPDGDFPYFGYYTSASRSMVMNIQTGTGTLVHELTHALIVYDFPGVPTWFNEGLGSLHEQCNVQEADIIGLTNWRLPGLHKAIASGTLRPLKDLLTERDFYGRQQGDNYAQARYFCMYMQKQGLLKRFYAYFRDHHNGESADVLAVEHVFGKKLPEIEKSFLAWVKTLKFDL